ncbi:unnamed protein product, partial [Brassica oleracea]
APETELLKLGSVGFHGGNVTVDRNDINRCWSAPLKSWTTLESGECLKLSLRLQKLRKIMMKSMNHHLRLSAITLLLRVVIPRPKFLPSSYVQSTYDYSQKWFFLSVWSHAQLTLASHCVLFGHTCKFDHSMSSSSSSLSYIPMVSSVTDMPLMPYPLEYSLLSTLALSSSSSDENAQGFTLRAPSFRTGVAVPVGVPSKEDAFRTHPMKLLNERNLKGTFFGNYKPKTDIPGVVKKYMNKELELEKFSLTQYHFLRSTRPLLTC